MIVKYYRKNDIFSFKNNLINFYPVGNIKNNRLNKRLFELGLIVDAFRTLEWGRIRKDMLEFKFIFSN